MELPSRPQSDRFVPAGELARLVAGLRAEPAGREIATLIVGAFDHRTRMLPFILWDRQIVPAGIRAVSAALAASGFTRQRVVNQAWTPQVRPSTARIDGAPPELLLVSAMQIHSAAADHLIRDAHRMGENRPLVIVGGPKAIYQPWAYFQPRAQHSSPDLVVTGEEYVFLALLERLLECRRGPESLLAAFRRARRRGWIDDIPGLFYDRSTAGEPEPELVDTGVQRLVRDFDELPEPVQGYRFLERPHSSQFLRRHPLALCEVHRHSRVASILTTRGCKFRCGYCPIPAYNQFTFRTKSPEGLVRDIRGLRRHLGIHLFFGTDDNFFNHEEIVQETFEALARAQFEKDDIGKTARFGTEATEFDVHKQMHLLPLCYRGGLRAIWFGVEDLTAELVNKGQSVSKTAELFAEMRRQRILPMAMMMHYDGQPLRSRDSMAGLSNQVQFLYHVGAASVQVTVLGPATGTKDYDAVMRSGVILDRLGNERVEDVYWDGNHVISVGSSSQPVNLQRNMLLAYGLFYNPVNLVRNFFRRHWKWSDLFLQLWGMWGLAVTCWRLLPWRRKLRQVAAGRYTVHTDVPKSPWKIVTPRRPGSTASPPPGYVPHTAGADERPAARRKTPLAVIDKY